MRKLDIAVIALIALTPITMVSAAYAQWGGPAPRHDYAPVPDDGDYMVARVVGYDCQGAGDMLLATDEDQLPTCARIEAIQPYAVPLSLEGVQS